MMRNYNILLKLSTLLVYLQGIRGINHVILHPKVFRIDADETVAVNLHGYGGATANIVADIQPSRRSHQNDDQVTARVSDSADRPITFKIKVPGKWFENEFELDTRAVMLNIRITFPQRRYADIRKRIRIAVSGHSDNIFVMTDSPIYKPGDTVQIRAAALDPHMLPAENDKMQFFIETEEGIGIWQSAMIDRDMGFFTTEYPTTELSIPGTFYAVAKIAKKGHFSRGVAKFIIDKYVLPSFNVVIYNEKRTVAPDEDINLRFRARYSYGEDVVGMYSCEATLHIPGNRSVVIYTYPSDPSRYRPGQLRPRDAGKGLRRIRTRDAPTRSGMSWPSLIEAGATISVSVSVRGAADGTIQRDVLDGIIITNSPYDLQLLGNSKRYIPGLEHVVDVLVLDKATGDPVGNDIEVSLLRRDNTTIQTERTDVRGRARFILDTRNLGTNAPIKISAGGLHVPLTLIERDIRNGYILMNSESHAKVGRDFEVEFRTQVSNPPGTIYYTILCRGSIIESKRISMSGSNPKVVRIPISRKMSPKIQVVGYFMSGDTMISDSVSITVEETCISTELTVGVEPIEERVNIFLQGQPNAHFAIRGFDKSARFLNDEEDISRDVMFTKMERLDMECDGRDETDDLSVLKNAGLGALTRDESTPIDRRLNCSADGRSRRKRSPRPSNDPELAILPSYWEASDYAKRCYDDGRKRNLGGLSCSERSQIVRRIILTGPLHENCLPMFEKGCETGRRIRLTTRLRQQFSRTSVQRLDVASSYVSIAPKKGVRDNFAVGWLWAKETLKPSGRYEMHNQSPPDSITTHLIDAISVHDEEGMCVAKTAKLTVFKNVFVRLFLPYSIKVMEEVQIRAAIFNYNQSEVTVGLRMKTDGYLCSVSSQGEFREQGQFTIASDSSVSIQFLVIAHKVPPENQGSQIEAEIYPVSKNDTTLDRVQRVLKIEEPGQIKEFSKTWSLDPKTPGQRHNMEFDFPDSNVVPGSRKCAIHGYMSDLGPLLEFEPSTQKPKDLTNTVKLPNGCGEQIMKSLGPNVFIYKYLMHNKKEVSQSDVTKYIATGYTKELGHRNNGRWAIWKTAEPTIWLNAYVDKVFLHAHDVWNELGMEPVCESINWLIQEQKPSGSFHEHHSPHHWTNIAEGADIALTAYVLVSLSEKSINCPRIDQINAMRNQAKIFLESSINSLPNVFTTALTTYALALVRSRDALDIAQQRLSETKNESNDTIHWESSNEVNRNIGNWRGRRQTSIDVEATAYALLAQLEIYRPETGAPVGQSEVARINKIYRWLVNQQDSSGGFITSQTTVVAIQAMVKYAIWIENLEPYMEDPRLQVTMSSSNAAWNSVMLLDRSHKYYRKTIAVPEHVINDSPAVVASDITGVGRGVLSYQCTYRTTAPDSECDYDINVETESEDKGLEIRLNITKKSPSDSRMGIIDISLMTGYIPVPDTLDAIKRPAVMDGVIDDYEISQTNVIIYVEKFEQKPLALGFKMTKSVDVVNPNPAQIHVYDYYNPEESRCTTLYSEPQRSPSIRSYCTKRNQSGRSAGRPICRCMDGGCPTFKTRDQQIKSTRERLLNEVCSRKYAYIIRIDGIDKETMPLYVKMKSTILENLYNRDVNRNDESDSNATIIIRNDCFESAFNDKGDQPFFSVTNLYLVRGIAVETKASSGSDTYFLDKDALIEKVLTQAICDKVKDYNKGKRGCNSRCKKKRKRDRICKKQDMLRRALEEEACEG